MLKIFAKLLLRMMQMTMCTQFFLRDMLGLKFAAEKRRSGGNISRRRLENIGKVVVAVVLLVQKLTFTKERNQAGALLHNP